jgi:hypothetical protein
MKTSYAIIATFALALSAFTPAIACEDSLKCKITSDSKFKYWEGLDIGVNGFLNPQNSITLPQGYEFLELDYARSRSFSWNIAQYNIHIYQNHINLVTGIGFDWNSYAFRNNVTLQANTDQPIAIEEGYDFSKNKLKTTFVRVPLMLEFNTSKKEKNNFHIGIGGTVGYNIFRNRLKQEFEADGDDQKRKTKDDFNVNPFRYGATARIGYGNFTLFANYDMSTFFKENRGPKMYPFSAGLHLSI